MLSKPLHVLIVPAWLPTSAMPHSGPFIPQQARAIMTHCPVQCGMIYRRHFWESPVLASAMEGIQSEVVTGAPWPKVSSAGIRLWNIAYDRAFKKYVARFGTPDLIHAHSYTAGFAAHFLGGKYNVPFILTEHATALLKGDVRSGQISAIRSVLRDASAIIAVSQVLANAVQKIADVDVHVIPNMYDAQLFYRKKGRDDKGSRFVSVGNLIARKRVDLLMRAFQRVVEYDANAVLTVIGGGEQRAHLEKLNEALSLTDNIRFTGPLDPQAVAEHMRNSNILVSASGLETFGITLIEGMACGLPVVVTPSMAAQEIITEDNGIITTTDTPDVVADAMIQALERKFDPSAIAEYAEANFSARVVARRTEERYQEVLSASTR